MGACAVIAMGLVSCADKFPVTFHMEGDGSDSSKMAFMLPIQGKPTKFVKAPFISNRDIESYRSFQDYKTGTYGAAFYLNAGAKNRYQAISAENYGRLVIPMANSKPCEVFRINRSYENGIIFIYSGLTKEDMNLMKEVIEPHPKEKERMKFNDDQEREKVKKLS